MDRYGRAGEEGSRSDPLIQWTSHGVESNRLSSIDSLVIIKGFCFEKMRVFFW